MQAEVSNSFDWETASVGIQRVVEVLGGNTPEVRERISGMLNFYEAKNQAVQKSSLPDSKKIEMAESMNNFRNSVKGFIN